MSDTRLPRLALLRRRAIARWRRELDAWAAQNISQEHGHDVDAAAARWCARSATAGWLRHAVGGTAHGGAADAIDTRAICLIRETLAPPFRPGRLRVRDAGPGLRRDHACTARRAEGALPADGGARRGDRAPLRCPSPMPAPTSAALACAARVDGDHYVLNGEKTWISNGGIADFYVVFARTGEAPGARGISAFIVDAGTPGFEIAERIDVIAPHPLARLRFTDCRVPATQAPRRAGRGLQGRDAHARRVPHLGRRGRARLRAPRARRGAAARHHAQDVRQTLADFQLTQAKLAQMATTIDARRC